MKTMTRSRRAKIASDWQREFPELGIVASGDLFRRVGPILEGITLNPGANGTIYEPIFHVHCLARQFPAITLTLPHPLLTTRTRAPQSITVLHHEARYLEAASRLRSQVPLSLTGNLKLSDVIAAYRAYFAQPGLGYLHSANLLFDDMIRICAYAGDLQQAQALIVEGFEIIRQFPPEVLECFGGAEQWRKKAIADIASVDQLRALADAQARLLVPEPIPSAELV